MKKNILELLKFHGISCFISVIVLILTFVVMGTYSILNSISVSLPQKIISITFSGNNDDFSIELSFIENFVFQFLLFTICLAIFLFSISKILKLKKYNYILLCLGVTVFQIVGFRLLLPKPIPLVNINISQIKEFENDKKNAVIYIGRENCPDCIIYEPKLKAFLNKEQLSIYYLDTTGDKSEVEKFRKFYNQLGVTGVPSVIFMKKGKIQNILYGNNDDSKIEEKINEYKLLI